MLAQTRTVRYVGGFVDSLRLDHPKLIPRMIAHHLPEIWGFFDSQRQPCSLLLFPSDRTFRGVFDSIAM